MAATDVAFAVRAGEHACCRAGDRQDRDRLAVAFVLAGLRCGYKVVVLRGARDVDATLGLLGWDTDPALRVSA
jgi:hypothetical protein